MQCFSLNRLMFWTERGQNAKIEKATLSGTQRVVMVTSNLHWPWSIDLDRRNKLIFWVDPVLDRVESVDYHGNNRKLLFQQPGFNFYGVTFLSSFLYVSDWATHRIYKFNATSANGTVLSTVKISPFIDGLVAYDSSRQLPGMHLEFISFSSDPFVKSVKHFLSYAIGLKEPQGVLFEKLGERCAALILKSIPHFEQKYTIFYTLFQT